MSTIFVLKNVKSESDLAIDGGAGLELVALFLNKAVTRKHGRRLMFLPWRHRLIGDILSMLYVEGRIK